MKESNNEKKLQTTTLAGGCFWCIEGAFNSVKGIVSE
jgi:peptide-methionine (S)-S-oxide reductase